MSRSVSNLFLRPALRQTFRKNKTLLQGLEPLEDRLALSAVGIAGDGLPVVDFTLDSQWQSGYTANISITNDETAKIDGWTLEFDLTGGISSIWNAEILSVDGDHYTVRNASWNNTIDAGNAVSFGFVSTVDASNLPDGFVFNGQTSEPAPTPDPQPEPTPDPEPEPTPEPDPDEAVATVSFEVTSDWQTGFGGQITITNTSDTDLDGWVLDFDFEGDIPAGSIWNASISEHGGDHYVINAASWNSRIAAGAEVSFGFNGSRADADIVPDNFQLNGTPIDDDGGGDNGNDDDVDDDDIDETPPSLSVEDVRISESDSGIADVVLRLTLSRPSEMPLSVYYATSVGTATAGEDYQAAEGLVTFESDETEKTVTLSVYGDTSIENTESFAVLFSTASDLSLERSQMDVTIVNDDFVSDGDGGRVIGYFVEWGIYGRDYAPMDIPTDDLTHVVYAFANISDSGEMIIYDSYAAVEKAFPGDTWDQPLRGNFNQLLKLKEQYPHLRTMIAVGGWTLSGKFSDVALTEASRELFAASAVEFIVEYGFDGIDFDWEYPGGGGLESNVSRPEDGANYVLLVEEIREQLDQQSLLDGKTYEISVASPAGFDKMENFQLAEMAEYIDWFNVMTYDYHGAWESTTNHQAPLYGSPQDPSWFASQYNIDSTIRAYIAAGVAPVQLNLGLPLYSRAWAGVGSENNGLYQTATLGAAPGTWERGMLDYKDVYNRLQTEPDAYTRYWDDAAMVPYVYSTNDGGTFMTYEDQESANAKIDYVMENELGGVFFWELSADVEDSDSPDSLVALASDRLLNVTA